MISDDDFFRLFNACARLAKTPNNPPLDARSFHDLLPDLNIDSLDSLVLGMYLCDIFGVPEEMGKKMQVRTVGDVMVFLVQCATVESIDVDKVISELK
jgi:hypothetical protein